MIARPLPRLVDELVLVSNHGTSATSVSMARFLVPYKVV